MEGKKKYNKMIFLLIFLLISYVGMYIAGIDGFWEKNQEESYEAIENAVRKSALQCYALEGSFPPSIEYLQENYGLIVNSDKYFYHYQPNGANIVPDIKVMKRWAEGDE